MPTPYRYLRCGDLRSPGVTERRNCPLGLRDDDDDDDDDNGYRTLKSHCHLLVGEGWATNLRAVQAYCEYRQ